MRIGPNKYIYFEKKGGVNCDLPTVREAYIFGLNIELLDWWAWSKKVWVFDLIFKKLLLLIPHKKDGLIVNNTTKFD